MGPTARVCKGPLQCDEDSGASLSKRLLALVIGVYPGPHAARHQPLLAHACLHVPRPRLLCPVTLSSPLFASLCHSPEHGDNALFSGIRRVILGIDCRSSTSSASTSTTSSTIRCKCLLFPSALTDHVASPASQPPIGCFGDAQRSSFGPSSSIDVHRTWGGGDAKETHQTYPYHEILPWHLPQPL